LEETAFWSFQIYEPECHKFTRTKPLVLTEAILSKGLTQSKTLDCEDSGEIVLYRNARASQLNQPNFG